jgi:energy-coupling factor transporter transmembrane protein EcfT
LGRIGGLSRYALYALANLVGLLAFAWLLLRPAAAEASTPVALSAPVLLGLLAGVAFLALLAEMGADGLGSKAVAVLGVLVAMNSVLRFIEVALPGPGGFTPIFVLIILAGYAYGARFGFLMGALTLAVSAVITGGVGPWLPFQMYAAGWVGLTSGWLPGRHRAPGPAGRWQIYGLALVGVAWTFAYGFIMTIWAWSFVDAGAVGAAPGSAPLARFVAYYVFTSLAWDAFGALGTGLLLVATGGPLLSALRRFEPRFGFTLVGPPMSPSAPAAPLLPSAPPPVGASGSEIPAPRASGPLHARAWLGWALGIAALASVTRNPFLLGGAALALAVVRAAMPRRAADPMLPPLGRVIAVVVLVAAGYNFLMAHSGDTVLLRLPSGWPLIGGPLTLEALAYGALTGLALALLLAVFATLRRALSARDMVRLVPRAFGALALVVAVALTYVPATLTELAAIREAQAVRGRRPKGPAGWLRLTLPLVVGGLERALTLAESLTARGLVGVPAASGGRWPDTLLLVVGVAAMLLGWLVPVVTGLSGRAGGLVVLAGMVPIVWTLARRGRRLPHTDYRLAPWRATDSLVVLLAWLPLMLALVDSAGRLALAWLPYPALDLSPPPPMLVLALVGLAAPALVLGRELRSSAAELPAT